MKTGWLEFRHRSPIDFPVGHVYLSVIAVGLVLVRLFHDKVAMTCPIKALTALPCPSCGITRGLTHLVFFDVKMALLSNPGLLLFGAMLTLYFALDAVSLHRNLKPIVRLDKLNRTMLSLAALAGLSLNWVYLVWAGI